MTDEKFEGLVTQIYDFGVTWMNAQLIDEARRARSREAAYREALSEMWAAHQRVDPHPFESCSNCLRARRVLDEKGEG
jgi:hypothetical protein